MIEKSGVQKLAWPFGLFAAGLCIFAAGFNLLPGLAYQPVTLAVGTLFGVLMGVLGALVAAREPRNSIGWLMCLASVSVAMLNLPNDYAYYALVLKHGALPFGRPLLWFGSWASIPVFGLILPFILARFPDGRVRPHWRAGDWVAIVGTVAFASSVAFNTAPLPLASPPVIAALAPYAYNPIGVAIPANVEIYLWMGGLFTIILAYVLAAGALVSRFRSASHDDAIRLKWFAYSGALITLGVVYSGIAWWFGGDLLDALTPFVISLVTLPIAIGIAILRYRLFDIDLIINRSVVYLTLTAVLGGLYTAGLTFFNRFVIAVTGQKSDAAYVLTAFVVVMAFGPLKDTLQHRVDKRLGGARSFAALEKFSAEVDSVISVLDVHRIACRLVDQAVFAFDAYGGELYLRAATEPLYRRGHINGDPTIEVELRHDGTRFGRLVLSRRRGDAAYSKHDRDALQRSADSVGEALAIAARFGHQPITAGRIAHGSTGSVHS